MSDDRDARKAKLKQAIIDHTNGEDMFWLGEFLLDVLERDGQPITPADGRRGK